MKRILPDALLSAKEWQKLIPVPEIIDPDGWRKKDGITMDTPITMNEYLARRNECTCRFRPSPILN